MNRPKIRFKGYGDDWEQRKLGDLVEVCSGRDYKHLEEGDVPVYGTGGYMLSVSESLSENDDAIGIGRKGTIDKPYILKAPFWTVDTLFYCVPRESNDLNFVFAIFQNINWKSMDESTGVPSLSKTAICKVEISAPGSEEQRKLGEYFSSLDNLITLHQRKCDETKTLKKYMLQKMFPQDGKKVPEIRFKGFTDDWEQRKLNEIADKVSEKNKNNEFSEPFTNSAEHGIISQKDYFDREIVNNENLNGYYIVRNDDFIYNPRISVTAPVGPINRNRLGRNGVMSPLYTVFRTHDIDNLYLEFYFKTTKWHRFMKLNGDSGARFDRFTISSTQFMEMPIPYPTLEEQQKIGEYFDSLDNLITLHQRKCDKLKEMKKYMLQNMFV
ncbi:restriction endonuclease subunit S [Lachnospiraceae bacterium HCP1S3_C11]